MENGRKHFGNFICKIKGCRFVPQPYKTLNQQKKYSINATVFTPSRNRLISNVMQKDLLFIHQKQNVSLFNTKVVAIFNDH